MFKTTIDGHVDFDAIYIDAIFARITALEQRVKDLESVAVLELFSAGDAR